MQTCLAAIHTAIHLPVLRGDRAYFGAVIKYDRIYVNHWIKAKPSDLLEGLHYAIMFYGGRLLSHLCYDGPPSDDEPAVADFVRLAWLEQKCVHRD